MPPIVADSLVGESRSFSTDAASSADPRQLVVDAVASPLGLAFNQLIQLLRGRKSDIVESSEIMLNLNRKRKIYLDTLNSHISQLGTKDYQPLIADCILRMDVLGSFDESLEKSEVTLLSLQKIIEERPFWKSYLGFMENLVSAHSHYCPAVLKTLIRFLRHGPSALPNHASSHSSSSTINEPEQSQMRKSFNGALERFYRRIHLSIRRISQLAPTPSTNSLPSILSSQFPQLRQSVEVHEKFVQHLLVLIKYMPTVAEVVHELLMARIVTLDGEITLDMDELEEEEEEFFQTVEVEDEDSDVDDDALAVEDSDDSKSASSAGRNTVEEIEDEEEELNGIVEEDREAILTRMKLTLSKLDRLMQLLFDHLHTISQSTPGSPDAPSPQMASTFQIFIQLFDKYVMRSHKCKYAQSIIFYITTWHASFSEALLSLLLVRMFDNTLSPYIRCTASAYFASFLARAQHIQPQIISHCLKLCSEWLHSSLDKHESVISGPCPSKLPLFYSTVQAILYVFCFRWRELTGSLPCARDDDCIQENAAKRRKTEESSTDEVDLFFRQRSSLQAPYMEWWRIRGGFQRIIFSKLNPLLVCAPPVVQEFDYLANDLQLMYCSSLISSNHGRRETPKTNAPSALLSPPYSDASGPTETPQNPIITGIEKSNLPTPNASPNLETDASQSAAPANICEVIESFFPFDPYFRHLSVKHWIEKYYLSWNSIRVEEDSECSETEEQSCAEESFRTIDSSEIEEPSDAINPV